MKEKESCETNMIARFVSRQLQKQQLFCYCRCLQIRQIRPRYFSNNDTGSKITSFPNRKYIMPANSMFSTSISILDVEEPLPRLPIFKDYESLWYNHWSEHAIFSSSNKPIGNNQPFSMILPPPNITGNLHLGHALTVTIQDVIARFQRMKGRRVAWIPGYDHAGIATQLILNKVLMKERGISIRDLTPEQFGQVTTEWRDKRMNEIREQLKCLGASLDFSKEFYTLSPEMSDVVKEAFITLFDQGLIQRKASLVSWSFFLKSTLSDIEIDWLHINGPTKLSVPGFDKEVEFGVLHRFAYPILEDPQKSIDVATTRLETMVGDVAVAVNPGDERYQHFVGKHVVHPLTGKVLPIVADSLIELDFGTGAMKITPSHSIVDYELGKKHGLPQSPIFDENGLIKCHDLKTDFEELNGMHRFDAKEKVVQMLTSLNLYHGSVPHNTKVPVCSRSGDVIETILREQWFLKTNEMDQELKSHLESGKVAVLPAGQTSAWISQWTKPNEWCISRQIRWGHQIPAFRVFRDNESTDRWVAAKSQEDAMQKLRNQGVTGNVRLVQDQDVLDTWFSSSLLPFSVFGMKSSKESSDFYPLSLMETGFDILGFWVHRMMIMGKAITGRYPFDKVLLHGMVCDAKGKKMSKSKGNVIDPREVIEGASLQELLDKSRKFRDRGLLTEKELTQAQEGQRKLFPNGIPECGSDALRWSLCQGDITAQQITMDVQNIAHNRTLINKMWQTMRFFEMHSYVLDGTENYDLDVIRANLSHMDAWILSRVAHLVQNSNTAFDNLQLHHLYISFDNFWYKDLCATHLEAIKSTLYHTNLQEKKRCMTVLKVCIETALKTIHPVIPFITEELYQRLGYISKQKTSLSILLEDYPKTDVFSCFSNPLLEDKMQVIFSVTKKMRSVMSQFKPTEKLELTVCSKDSFLKGMESAILSQIPIVGSLTVTDKLTETNSESLLKYSVADNQDVLVAVKPTASFLDYNIRQLDDKLTRLTNKLQALKLKFDNKRPTKDRQARLDFLIQEITESQQEMDNLKSRRR